MKSILLFYLHDIHKTSSIVTFSSPPSITSRRSIFDSPFFFFSSFIAKKFLFYFLFRIYIIYSFFSNFLHLFLFMNFFLPNYHFIFLYFISLLFNSIIKSLFFSNFVNKIHNLIYFSHCFFSFSIPFTFSCDLLLHSVQFVQAHPIPFASK